MSIHKFLSACLVFVLCNAAWGCVDMSSIHGFFVLEAPNGEKLYFRREAWGLNDDHLSLTTNNNVCSKPDPATDVIFVTHGTTVFYKFEGTVVHIYNTSMPEMPKDFSEKITVVPHKLTNPEFLALRDGRLVELGLTLVAVELDESIKCP